MIERLRLHFGTVRLQILFLLFAGTGFGNLLLNSMRGQGDWVQSGQTVLVIVWLVGTALVVFSAAQPEERGRWLGLLLPAVGLVLLGVVFLPDFLPWLIGGAIGWVFAGVFIFRPRGPMEYQRAVKLLRKNEFAEAIEIMDGMIKSEPQQANHYRFRAELLRLWGKLDRARRDYRKMTQLDPESAVAWNGLAEVELQAGQYEAARRAGIKALELAPDEWVSVYNLGMIEDRMELSDAVIAHLEQALQMKIPDARHRLLIHLYLARAYARRGDLESAAAAVKALKRHQGGLNEWLVVMQSDQAETLRRVLQADIDLAQSLVNDEVSLDVLAQPTKKQ